MTKFQCVELNSSFYNLPRETTVAGWLNRTPHTFSFCPKLSRYITHQMQLVNIDESLDKFFGVFKPMKERLGPVLIQLPPGLSLDITLISNFFNLIQSHYCDFRLAVEIRNRSWIKDEFFELLEKLRIGFVIADSGNRYPTSEKISTDFVYLRFHGRENLYASDYSERVLNEYADKIINWIKEGKDVWAFFNNDYYGYAVKNALRLRDIVEFRIGDFGLRI